MGGLRRRHQLHHYCRFLGTHSVNNIANLISQELDLWLETAHLLFYINSRIKSSAPQEIQSPRIDPEAPRAVLSSRGLEYVLPKSKQSNGTEQIFNRAAIDACDPNTPKANTFIRADAELTRMKRGEEFYDLSPNVVLENEAPRLPSQPLPVFGGVRWVDPINLEPVAYDSKKIVVKASSAY